MKKQSLIILAFSFIGLWAIAQEANKNLSISGINPFQISENSTYQKSVKSWCDTVFSFKTRSHPTGLTTDGQYLWYVDNMYIYKVSTTGIHVDSIPIPPITSLYSDGDLTYDGINLWYANEESAQLYKMDPSNGSVLQQFNLPCFGQASQNGWGLAWDGVNIWHSQYQPARIYKLDATTGTALNTLTTTTGLLGIEWINGNLFGTRDTKIFKINTSTGAFLDSAQWCIPFPLGLTNDGSSLWDVSGYLPNGNQRIYKLNSDITVSVSEISNSYPVIEIVPNPFTSQTTITFSEQQTNTTIKITNMFGEEIKTIHFTGKQLVFDKAEMKAGIYFVQTTDEKKKVTNNKIIIQ